jgi:putative transposase
MFFKRNRTPTKHIYYALHLLYFSGLSLRKVLSEHLSPFIKRNHVSIWNWIQHHKPQKLFHRKRRIYEFIVDETLIKVGTELVWVWIIAIELKDKTILGIHISYVERSILIAEQFIQSLVRKYGKHPVSTDGDST